MHELVAQHFSLQTVKHNQLASNSPSPTKWNRFLFISQQREEEEEWEININRKNVHTLKNNKYMVI